MIFYLFIFILNLLIVVVNWTLKILVKNKEKREKINLKIYVVRQCIYIHL